MKPKPRILLKQGSITLLLILAFTFVVFYALSFNGYDLIWLQRDTLDFMTKSGIKGYAIIILVGLWLFTLLSFFFPIIQEVLVVEMTSDWSKEYPLWKEEFRQLPQGQNHPNLAPALPVKNVANVSNSKSLSEIILKKNEEDEEALDKILSTSKYSIEKEKIGEIESQSQSKVQEQGKIEAKNLGPRKTETELAEINLNLEKEKQKININSTPNPDSFDF